MQETCPGLNLTAWVADSSGKAWPINNLADHAPLGTAVTGMT